MRLNQQTAAIQSAPAAYISFAVLEKINGTIKLICPTGGRDFPPVFIN